MGFAQDVINQLALVLAREGATGRLIHVNDPPGTPGVTLRFLVKHPSLRDESIVNAYGVNAQIVTMSHQPEFETAPPEKFDRIERVTGDPLPYVFDAVVRREVAGIVVGWTGFIKGKGA